MGKRRTISLLSLIAGGSTDDRIGVASDLVDSACDVALDLGSSGLSFTLCVFTLARAGEIG